MRQCKRHVQARFQRVRPDHQWTFENPRRHMQVNTRGFNKHFHKASSRNN